MADLKVHPNPGAESAVLTVDSLVVGGIKREGKAQFEAYTPGSVPALDGISGRSVAECWQAIVSRVSQGDVIYHSTIQVNSNDAEIL